MTRRIFIGWRSFGLVSRCGDTILAHRAPLSCDPTAYVTVTATLRRIVYDDNLSVLRDLPSNSAPLIYIDPPFNTGTVQVRENVQTVQDENGDRRRFLGRL
jgi:hypothetical protein